MISDMEIALLNSLQDRLQISEDSDHVREGRALSALIEAHAELKKPHVRALAGAAVIDRVNQASTLRSIASGLSAAEEASRNDTIPDEAHKEALRVAVSNACAALLQEADSLN
jgi:hypothetical protein